MTMLPVSKSGSGLSDAYLRFGFALRIALICLWGGAVRAEITVHAVMDRFGAATSFVNDSGQLWAWGANADGQYGDGTREAVVTARKLAFPTGVRQWSLFRTGARFLALDQDGRLYVWGEPEVTPLASHVYSQAMATRLGADLWIDVVTPEVQQSSDTAPFGLGVDSTGVLRWLRAPMPASTNLPPFAGFRTDPVAGDAGLPGFKAVAAGAHGFLALTTDGRIFAAGIPSSGFRGPLAPMVGDTFSAQFFEVPKPGGITSWARIAAVGETAFGWGDTGKLYTWGLQNPPPGEISLQTNPVPTAVPAFPGVSSWTDIQGCNGCLLSLDNSGRIHSGGGPLWLSRLGANGGWEVNAAIVQLPASWTPIRSFSEADSHLLVYGHDGKIHSLGDNRDFQLGQPGGGSASDAYVPLIPAGFAPFLSGAVARFPTINLELLDDLVVEPDSPSGTNGHAGKLRVHSTPELSGGGLLHYQLSTRLANGDPNPDPTTTNLVQITSGYYPFGYYDPVSGLMDFDVRPLFNDAQDAPLLLDVNLLPGIDYYLGEHPSVTLRYQATKPVNHPPKARLVWPPLNSTVYYQDAIDFVVEVSDQDGYVARVDIGLLFTAAGDLNRISAVVPSSESGSTNLVRLRLKPFGIVDEVYPKISVTDDRGLVTQLPANVQLGFRGYQISGVPLSVVVRGQVYALTVPATLGALELQGSEDLHFWTTIHQYTIPKPGLPLSTVTLDPDASVRRYYRLANPDSP